MIPKFKRPVFAFTLCAVAIASWFAAGAILFDLYSGPDGFAIEPMLLVFPAILCAIGLMFFGLGRLILHAAEASHYLKYLCWEHRIANQLAEKKQASLRASHAPAQDLSTLEPIERLFRSVVAQHESHVKDL